LTAAAVGFDSNWSGLRVYWYCGGPLGCGAHVTDRGPYDGYPSDCESGHVDGCRRLAAEEDAKIRENEEAETRGQVMDEALERLLPGSFARDTAIRARDVLAHGGQYRGWSTGETLAVALALNDEAMLKQLGYTDRAQAIQRVGAGLTSDPQGCLALIRAAVTGER